MTAAIRSLVLGLDVSPKRLGWGLVDLVTGEPVACGMEPIDLPSMGWRHQQVARALEAFEKAAYMGRWQGPYWERTAEVQAVYIEQPALPPVSGTKSAYMAGRAVQAVHGEVERRWPWAETAYLQPAEWKRLADVPKSPYLPEDIYGVLPEPLPRRQDIKPSIYMRAHLAGFSPGAHQDAADAALIALAGQRRNLPGGHPDDAVNWQAA